MGYQQALADFAITDLLHRIHAYSDANVDAAWAALTSMETEALAAILIQALTSHLDSDLLATYVDAIHHAPLATATFLNKLPLSRPSTALPNNFPNVEMPRFLYGDRLRWKLDTEPTDRGIAIGRFYSFAPHRYCWQWCYLIWLDDDSPSSAWVRTDIAWEDDLEPLVTESLL